MELIFSIVLDIPTIVEDQGERGRGAEELQEQES